MFDDELMTFIHEPARLLLLTHLAAVKKADFVFLLNSTQLSRGNLSVQMSRLQEKGLATIEKMIDQNRPRTVYQITRSGRNALRRYKREMLDLLEFLTVQDMARLMLVACGQLVDARGGQGERLHQTNYAQHYDVVKLPGVRGNYVESWNVYWISAHFLTAAAQFAEMGVDLETW